MQDLNPRLAAAVGILQRIHESGVISLVNNHGVLYFWPKNKFTPDMRLAVARYFNEVRELILQNALQ